jgi:hypothetical protein
MFQYAAARRLAYVRFEHSYLVAGQEIWQDDTGFGLAAARPLYRTSLSIFAEDLRFYAGES